MSLTPWCETRVVAVDPPDQRSNRNVLGTACFAHGVDPLEFRTKGLLDYGSTLMTQVESKFWSDQITARVKIRIRTAFLRGNALYKSIMSSIITS